MHHAGANVRSDYVNGFNPKDGILYSVRTFDQDSSLVTKKGWDDVTGIGTPTGVYPQAFADSYAAGARGRRPRTAPPTAVI